MYGHISFQTHRSITLRSIDYFFATAALERAFLLELRLVERLGALGAAAARALEAFRGLLRDLLFLGAFGFAAERALLRLLERFGALGAAAALALELFPM